MSDCLQELEDLLIEGFGAPSNSHIDIFAAAAQLAAGSWFQRHSHAMLYPVFILLITLLSSHGFYASR